MKYGISERLLVYGRLSVQPISAITTAGTNNVIKFNFSTEKYLL